MVILLLEYMGCDTTEAAASVCLLLQLRSPFPKLIYTFRKASGPMSVLMFVARDQGQGFGRKMRAHEMFGLGMPPALLLL